MILTQEVQVVHLLQVEEVVVALLVEVHSVEEVLVFDGKK
jgi:hypothetical protein